MKPLSIIKKYASLFLAMAMTVALCIPNNFVYASQSSTITGVEVFNKQMSFTDTLYPYDSNLPIPPTNEESHPSGSRVVYWYNLYDKEFLYNSSTDVYAYKFHVICSDVTLTQKGLQTLNFVFGSDNNFSTLESFNVGLSIMQAGECNYWYVNDYVNTPIYFGALALFGDDPSTASNINYSAKFKIDVISYSMDDMLDEIYEQLLDLVAGQEDLYNELVKIYDTSASIDTKLTTIRGQLESIKTAMPVLHTDLMNIEKALNSIQSTLDDMLEEDKKQTSWLERLWNGFFGKDEKNEPALEDFENNVNNKTDILDDYNNDIDNVEKPNVDELNNVIDTNLPTDNWGYLTRIFDSIYIFDIPEAMAILTCVFVIMGYAFFGKR